MSFSLGESAQPQPRSRCWVVQRRRGSGTLHAGKRCVRILSAANEWGWVPDITAQIRPFSVSRQGPGFALQGAQGHLPPAMLYRKRHSALSADAVTTVASSRLAQEAKKLLRGWRRCGCPASNSEALGSERRKLPRVQRSVFEVLAFIFWCSPSPHQK